VGAGLAFEAAQERYSRQDFIALNYHVHIPQPDPMVNPSSVYRREFYGVNSSPTYVVDGETSGGGGSADSAKSLFDSRVEPMIQKHLALAPRARIAVKATAAPGSVTARANVSRVTSTSARLRLHIVLAEEWVSFSGENGHRFHSMVVRGMATAPAPRPKPGADPAAPAYGFALKPGTGGTFEFTFDLARLAADGNAHLEDFEKGRPGYHFRERKNAIGNDLVVVAFVQDEDTKAILQSTYFRLAGPKTTN
jgi:hypothetical protein